MKTYFKNDENVKGKILITEHRRSFNRYGLHSSLNQFFVTTDQLAILSGISFNAKIEIPYKNSKKTLKHTHKNLELEILYYDNNKNNFKFKYMGVIHTNSSSENFVSDDSNETYYGYFFVNHNSFYRFCYVRDTLPLKYNSEKHSGFLYNFNGNFNKEALVHYNTLCEKQFGLQIIDLEESLPNGKNVYLWK
jgi:hypothetical protein